MLVVFHHFYWCSIKVHLPPNCLFIQISGIWIPKKKRKNGKRRISFYYWGVWHTFNVSILFRLLFSSPCNCQRKEWWCVAWKLSKKGGKKPVAFEIIICYQNLWPAETVERACKRRIFIPYQKPFISLSNTFNSLLLLFPTENKCARTLFFGIIGCGLQRYC